jgi:hypothetical protein
MTAMAAEYSDTNGHWAKAEIDKWSDAGILTGDNGSFRPDDSITRAEMATIFDRTMAYRTKAVNTFTDLGESWYTDAILRANAAGLMLGSDGLVRPNDKITRQETAILICRAIGLPEKSGNTSFADDASIAPWAKGYVNALASAGLIAGVGDNRFAPTDNINRASVVKMLDNATKGFYSKPGEYTGDVAGNVVVNTANVTLKNMKVSGNLIIAEGVGDGDVYMDNVSVAGKLIVRGGGANSIHITGNSQITNVTIQKTDGGAIRVVTDSNAVVEAVYVDDGKDDVILTGTFKDVTVAADVPVSAVDANITNINVTGAGASLAVDTASKVAAVNVAETATKAEISVKGEVGSLTANAEVKVNNQGTIKKADVKADNVVIDGNKPVEVAVDSSVKEPPKSSDGKPVESGNTGNTGSSGGGSSSVAVTGINIDEAEITLAVGTSKTLVATVLPNNATNKTVTWSTSDADVATVDSNGQVTAVSVGTATITAKSNNNIEATCEVTVKNPSTATFTLDGEGTYSNDNYGNVNLCLGDDLKVTGTLKYHAADPTGLGFQSYDHYFMVFKIAGLPNEGATVTIKGKTEGDVSSTTYNFESTNDVVVWGVEDGEDIEITVDYGENYAPMVYTLDLSEISLAAENASLARIEKVKLPSSDALKWANNYDHSEWAGLTVTGYLDYVAQETIGSAFTGENWFLPFAIVAPKGVAVGNATVTITGKQDGDAVENNYTGSQFETLNGDDALLVVWGVEAGEDTITIEVDWDGNGTAYTANTYTIDLSGVTLAQPVPEDKLAFGQNSDVYQYTGATKGAGIVSFTFEAVNYFEALYQYGLGYGGKEFTHTNEDGEATATPADWRYALVPFDIKSDIGTVTSVEVYSDVAYTGKIGDVTYFNITDTHGVYRISAIRIAEKVEEQWRYLGDNTVYVLITLADGKKYTVEVSVSVTDVDQGAGLILEA